MLGTDRNTGKPLSGLDHLRQSIADILTTPIGSRVGRRNYGSRVFTLIDAPLTAATINDLYQAAAEAIITWEPRIQVTKIKVIAAETGRVLIDVLGRYTPDGSDIIVRGISVTASGAPISPDFNSSDFNSSDFSLV